DVSPDSYSVVSTEWADGSRSDMVYASPILIEIQYQVFMLRLIKYCSNVYQCYRALPIILVLVAKSFSSVEFTTNAEGLMLGAVCKFWAKK
ncbi:hypothetical protein EDC96DRAFT_422477, partial [Choanephora cucurbitarum]